VTDGPTRIGPLKEVTLTGQIFAWKDGQPVFLQMPGSPSRYLPCFKTEKDLRALYARLGLPFTSIKLIEDGPEFLTSFYGTDVIAICDVRYTEEGRVRFVQVLGAD
jgi:hypothetical protein